MMLNDAIHLKFAEKYCKKLITFDNDFKKFTSYTELEIEILQSEQTESDTAETLNNQPSPE